MPRSASRRIARCLIWLSLCLSWGCGSPPGSPAALRVEASALIEQPPLTVERLGEAERLLQQAWSIDASSADTATLLGDLYAMRHKAISGSGHPGTPSSSEPADWYRRALGLDPDNVRAHRGLASYHLRRWEPDRALEHCLKLRALSPGDVQVEIAIGRCYLLLQDYGEAERVLRGALSASGTSTAPEDRETIQDLLAETLMSMGQDARAESLLSHATKANLQRPESGRKAALRDDPTGYAGPWVGLGLIYLRQGRTEEARDHLQHAIEREPNIDPRKYNELARIRIAEGRLDEAETLLRKSLEILPQPSNEAHSLLEQIGLLRQEGSAKPPSR